MRRLFKRPRARLRMQRRCARAGASSAQHAKQAATRLLAQRALTTALADCHLALSSACLRQANSTARIILTLSTCVQWHAFTFRASVLHLDMSQHIPDGRRANAHSHW